MGVGIYHFYHGFGLKAFEGRHIRMRIYNLFFAGIRRDDQKDGIIM